MLYINDNDTTVFNVTLYSNCGNITNPYFTWKLINKQSLNEIVFYQDDSSTSPYYYNSFTVSIAPTAGLTQGIINAAPGEYKYEIYEMSNKYDLDLNNSIGLVENGILYIVPTYSQTTSFTQSLTPISTYTNLDRI